MVEETIKTVEPLFMQTALDAAKIGLWDVQLVSPWTVVWDDRCKDLFGIAKSNAIPYEEAIQHIHPKDKDTVDAAVKVALTPGSHGSYNMIYRTIGIDDKKVRWVNFIGKATFNDAGVPVRFTGVARDITGNKKLTEERDIALLDVKDLNDSKNNFRTIVDQAPMAISLLRGRTFIIETANELVLRAWGKDKSIIGLKLIEALPELKEQQFVGLLEKVYDTGEPFYGYATPAKLDYDGELKDVYFDFIYTPVKDNDGVITGVMVLANIVTEQVLSKLRLEESELKLRDVINEAPIAIGLLVGKNMILENPNQTFIEILGKGPGINGLPLSVAMPELLTESQPFLNILDEVYKTGIKFETSGTLIKILKNGILEDRYFDFSYIPLFDANNKVYAILDVANEVTGDILAKQKLRETEAFLSTAIELAEIATWEVDSKTGAVILSERLRDIFGLDDVNNTTLEVIGCIAPEDQQRVLSALTEAQKPGGNRYNIIYRIINKRTKSPYIVHAIGELYFNEDGSAKYIMGTVIDITAQTEIRMALENEVQKRTAELQASNEKLEATNEELAESIENLNRTNDELSQYAYIASHDLQEPLRKILVYSDLLKKKDYLPAPDKLLAQKINNSSDRMRLLIKDLLEFSRLPNSDETKLPVNLNNIVKGVVNDFDLMMEEKKATVTIENSLPELVGVPLQMNQLFYNLLSNALKFSKADVDPVIKISSKKITRAELEKHLPRYNKDETYYQITFTDNGIGFDDSYADQIFEVFMRLHGRDAYAGSGIGLALCRKIVINHGGVLYALSEPSKGSAFHIIIAENFTASGANVPLSGVN